MSSQSFARAFACAVLLSSPVLSLAANPPLIAVGPVDAALASNPTFPIYYLDSNRVALEPCLDQVTAFCALGAQPGVNGTTFDPLAPIVWPTNFPGAFLYASVETDVTVFGVAKGFSVFLTFEGTFATDAAGFVAASPFTFTHIRFDELRAGRAVPFTVGGIYTVTYPYGTVAFTADINGNLFPAPKRAFLQDAPAAPVPGAAHFIDIVTDPTNAMGTFLSAASGAPAGFMGDGATLVPITGSPTGNNFVRIEGPGLGPNCPVTLPTSTDCVESTTFRVVGKKSSGGPAARFVVTGLTDLPAGTPQTVTVTAIDLNGVLAQLYGGTVHFTSTGAEILPADATLTKGVGTFSVTPRGVGAFTLTPVDAANAAITGSQSVAIGPKLVAVSGFGQTGAVGTQLAQPLVVKVVDGNNAAVAGVTVSFAPPAAGVVTSPSLTTGLDGVASTPAKFGGAAGIQDFTVSAPGALPITLSVNASPGPPASFRLTGPGTIVAGQTGTVAVASIDAFGNPSAGFTGALTLASSDAVAVLPATPALALGTAQLEVMFKSAGAQTLTVSRPGATPATVVTTVSPAAASALVVVAGDGESGPAGRTLPVALSAKVTDAFGNAVPGVLVTFTAPPGSLVGAAGAPPAQTASAPTDADGTAAVTASLASSPGAQTFTAAVTGLTGSPASFTVTGVAAPAPKGGCASGPGGSGASALLVLVALALRARRSRGRA